MKMKLKFYLRQFMVYQSTNELISEIFRNQYNLKYIGLRFFTVYGENSRRDMAVYKFIDNVFKGKKVELFNEGKYKRELFI